MSVKIDFNEIYEEFYPKIVRYLSRLTGRQEGEDIAQEVFEKASRGLKSFKGESKLSTWLYRIATNTAIDRMRSPSFRRSSEYTSLNEDTGTEDRNVWSGHTKSHIDQTVIRKEMSECVREFIDRLSSDYKTVILLSELEGFKNSEIADILQVSLDTVKIRLHRARARLKKELDDGCTFYHSEQDILACDRKQSQILPKIPK
ncbi:MAG: RNA polymerase sigma factor [Deltaproteobacteria bacterium]|nr:RNA polymerase sigma factor [Deltaproteobacteria bacterium]MBW2573175.1 RNA polymerase sigma factor [Deltaproteobacteria bacterium]MBW2670204.1 RNA polymerase sigma factor [Deltaproteobacteria bacterium]MBW2711758.1 RNA polymerase sigma factor [Deltaproteobacteria bacterium]